MFEPPSPPQPVSNLHTASTSHPSRLSQTHTENSLEADENVATVTTPNDGNQASVACRFTFAVPRGSSLLPTQGTIGSFPQAQSTPNPPLAINGVAPATDPRLRLFQLQYDTYTRDHLSAMVDSIAINTPSGTGSTPSPTSFAHGLSRVSEASVPNMSHLRSTKRVKLSPRSDYYGEGAGAGASIARPKIIGKDYVGESRALMQQIKQTRDFSTISTVASAFHCSSPGSHDGQDEDFHVVQGEQAQHSSRNHGIYSLASHSHRLSVPCRYITTSILPCTAKSGR